MSRVITVNPDEPRRIKVIFEGERPINLTGPNRKVELRTFTGRKGDSGDAWLDDFKAGSTSDTFDINAFTVTPTAVPVFDVILEAGIGGFVVLSNTQIRVDFAGRLQISLNGLINMPTGGGTAAVRLQVYVNGAPFPEAVTIGTIRSPVRTTHVAYVASMAVEAGDIIDIRALREPGGNPQPVNIASGQFVHTMFHLREAP